MLKSRGVCFDTQRLSCSGLCECVCVCVRVVFQCTYKLVQVIRHAPSYAFAQCGWNLKKKRNVRAVHMLDRTTPSLCSPPETLQ